MESGSRFPPALKVFLNVIGDQLSKHLLKVFMNDGSAPGPDPGLASVPMLVDLLEDRKAKPNNPFGRNAGISERLELELQLIRPEAIQRTIRCASGRSRTDVPLTASSWYPRPAKRLTGSNTEPEFVVLGTFPGLVFGGNSDPDTYGLAVRGVS